MKVAIVYASTTGNTESMANAIKEAVEETGAEVYFSTADSASVADTGDTISLSPEAEKMAEMYYMDKIAQETPDVRADRIAEIKEKIKDPNYLSDSVIKSAADNFLSAIGI